MPAESVDDDPESRAVDERDPGAIDHERPAVSDHLLTNSEELALSGEIDLATDGEDVAIGLADARDREGCEPLVAVDVHAHAFQHRSAAAVGAPRVQVMCLFARLNTLRAFVSERRNIRAMSEYG